MLSQKFPPGFEYNKRGIQIDNDIWENLPDYEELNSFVEIFISIREKYCPIANYDISGRSSRGIFIGIPDCGIQAATILQNQGICGITTCTFTSDRRSATSRNCYLWDCEKKMKLTSFGLVDALERWYPVQSIMTPIYLDISSSIPSLNVEVKPQKQITIRGIDLGEILSICLSKTIPFVCLRINKENVPLLSSFQFNLRAFEVCESLSEKVIVDIHLFI